MSHKALRKELELNLVKSIEEVLNKVNTISTKKNMKSIKEASKLLSKKLFKTIKAEVSSKKVSSKVVKKNTQSAPPKTTKNPIKRTIKK